MSDNDDELDAEDRRILAMTEEELRAEFVANGRDWDTEVFCGGAWPFACDAALRIAGKYIQVAFSRAATARTQILCVTTVAPPPSCPP